MSSMHAPTIARVLVLLLSFAGCAPVVREAAAPRAFPDADSIASSSVVPGIIHTSITDSRGPWVIHVIEAVARQCVPVLEARKAAGPLDRRALASALTSDAIAGINADFFMLPGGTPVGAHVSGGVPLIGPTDRVVFGETRDGWRIGVAAMSGYARARDDSVRVSQINRPARAFSAYRGTSAGVTLFTTLIGDTIPADSAARRVTLRLLAGNEADGRAVVVALDTAYAARTMPAGGVVLLASGTDRDWAGRRAVGDTVSWQTHVSIGELPLVEAVGAFPELLRDGLPVLARQTVAESFGARRHPRTAIGWTPGGRLLLVVVDGRQPGWSEGMSLDELTWLFQRLGASDAVNLDGGGSTAMVVRGTVVNRPSDREGERAVGNALAITGCR